jgi:prolipoprotein diacylglyceryl transferase
MAVAFLPSPDRGVWQLGPIPLRAYALCAVAGIVVALWLTDRRYRRMGGPRGMIWDVATFAVPAGIIGARAYSVLTDYRAYFAPGRDWVAVLRIWDGGLGIAGAAVAAALGAWAYCRRQGYSLAPIALAAAPALPVAQAIAVWGNWFNQRMYGKPSSLPWAVIIGPARRTNGYESFSTFQPVFLYESLWDLLVAAAVAYAIRRFLLTGDRAFALYGGLYALGRLTAEVIRIDYSPRVLGARVTELGMLLVIFAAAAYLGISRARRRDPAALPVPPPAATAAAAATPAAAQPVTHPASPAPAGSAAPAAPAALPPASPATPVGP